MQAVFTFPPDYDGDLRVNVERTEHNTLEIKLTLAVGEEEGILPGLKRLGEILANQPAYLNMW